MAKTDAATKNQIRDLIRQGYSTDQIKQAFPHVDGRVISGLFRDMNRQAQGVQAAGAAPAVAESPAIPNPNGETPSPAVSEVPATPPAPPAPPAGAIPAATVYQSIKRLGFTPNPNVLSPAHRYGFGSVVKDEFIIYKDGVFWKQMPAVPKTELLKTLPAGNYIVEIHSNGQIVHKESLVVGSDASGVPPASSPISSILQNRPPYYSSFDWWRARYGQERPSPVKEAAEAMKTVAEVVKSEKDVSIAKESALVKAMGDITSKALESAKSGTSLENVIATIIALSQKQLETAQAQHKMLMEQVRQESELRMKEMEKRYELDLKRQEELARVRAQEQQQLFAKLSELDNRRHEVMMEMVKKDMEFLDNKHRDIIESMEQAMNDMKERVEHERRHYEDLYRTRHEYEQKMVELKLQTSDKGAEIEKTKMIANAIVSGIGTVANRIENAVAMRNGDTRTIPQVAAIGARSVQSSGGPAPAAVAQERPVVEEKPQSIAESVMAQPWFGQIRSEVIRTIKRRMEISDPKLKPHGSLMASLVIEKVNEDVVRRRPYIHYLITRSLDEIIKDAEKSLSDEEKKILQTDEAKAWFQEFQTVLTLSWNAAFMTPGE